MGVVDQNDLNFFGSNNQAGIDNFLGVFLVVFNFLGKFMNLINLVTGSTNWDENSNFGAFNYEKLFACFCWPFFSNASTKH